MHTLDQWQTTHSIVTCLLDEQLTLHHLNNFNPMLTVSEYTTARGLCAAIRAVHACLNIIHYLWLVLIGDVTTATLFGHMHGPTFKYM